MGPFPFVHVSGVCYLGKCAYIMLCSLLKEACVTPVCLLNLGHFISFSKVMLGLTFGHLIIKFTVNYILEDRHTFG